jgi:hypothetical protein
MKKLNSGMIFVTAGILAILLGANGNIYGEQIKIEQHFGEHQLSAQLKIYIHFDKDPSYYHDGLVISNGTETKIDVGELAQKYISPFWIKLNFYGNDHPENEVCLKNLDSDKKNCEDVNSDDTKIDIDMPN